MVVSAISGPPQVKRLSMGLKIGLSTKQPSEQPRLVGRREESGRQVVVTLAQIGKLALVAFGAVTFDPFAFFRLPRPFPEFFDQFGPDRFRHGFGGGRVDPRGGRGFRRSEHPDQFGHEEKPLAALQADLIAANIA